MPNEDKGPGWGVGIGVALALAVAGWFVLLHSVPEAPRGVPDAEVAPPASLVPEEVAEPAAPDAGGEPEAAGGEEDAGFVVTLEPAPGVEASEIEGLEIELEAADPDGGALQTVPTDASGVARFGHLSVGRYRVELVDSRFAEASDETEVAEGGNEALVLRLDAAAEVRGDVRDPEGRPVAGAGLTFDSENDVGVTSAADGSFDCRRCPASATELDLDPPPGFAGIEPKPLSLHAGANAPLHLVLTRLRPLEVVVDFGGAPPAAGEARVELQGPGGFEESREVEGEDTVRFDGVPPDGVEAQLEDETGQLAGATVPAGAATIALRVPSNNLEVEVGPEGRGPGSERSSRVVVQCPGEEPRSQLPDRGGKARFRWLPAKPCEVQFESQAKTTVTPPGTVKLEP